MRREIVTGDLDEELSSHIQLMADEEIRRGVPRDEAYRRARVRFGSVESAKESYRDQRGLPLLEIVLQDLRYAVRGIRRNPGFATVAILSLAIGIGANTAIFSLVNGVLLRPLAFRDPESVFAVREITSNRPGSGQPRARARVGCRMPVARGRRADAQRARRVGLRRRADGRSCASTSRTTSSRCSASSRSSAARSVRRKSVPATAAS